MREEQYETKLFKTLRQEFGLDSLPQHAAQEVEPATLVVNPAMRVIEKALKKNRRQAGKLRREQAQLRGRRGQSARTRRAWRRCPRRGAASGTACA